jgi:hypothetical protein
MARVARNWNDFNQPLRDRRQDVYEAVLGNAAGSGAH